MNMQKVIKSITQEPKKLFLIDGYGALLSSLLYGMVLSRYESVFGVPQKTVYFLGVLAGLYAVYSFSCYLIKLKDWRLNMKIIAMANLIHCCLTIGIVIFYFYEITLIGILYFFGELIIVVPLALWEMKTAATIGNQN